MTQGQYRNLAMLYLSSNFEVVDCPEFLVHFPTLVRLAERHGLMMIGKQRFQNFFQAKKDAQDGRMLLSRMNALETFPSRQTLIYCWEFLESVFTNMHWINVLGKLLDQRLNMNMRRSSRMAKRFLKKCLPFPFFVLNQHIWLKIVLMSPPHLGCWHPLPRRVGSPHHLHCLCFQEDKIRAWEYKISPCPVCLTCRIFIAWKQIKWNFSKLQRAAFQLIPWWNCLVLRCI